MKRKHELNFIFITYLFVILSLNSFGKEDGEFYYENAVYNEEIKSVQLYGEGFELSHPIYELGSDSRLILKFDDLSAETKNYYYTVIHCDANWNESFITQNEYIDGFPENPIDDYAASFNTSMPYINYQLAIPNDEIKLNYSGNYVVIVYEDQDKEKLVFTQRFQVLNPKVTISGLVKRATFDPFKGDNQEVDFTIYHEQLRIDNPREDLKVVLMKNRRWDNAIRDLKPLFIRENELVYDYSKENVFKGGNEYRYFDIRTTRFNGENVLTTTFHRPYYHATLLTDEIRSNKKYFSYKEMNGNFVVESQDRVQDYDTECDYIFVHFTLQMDAQLIGGSVNVFGALTGWNANKSNEMSWNYETAGYELTMLLKQGYYNFQYVYVPEGKMKAEEEVLEGSHVETENEYEVLVYFKGISGRYDELVGYQLLRSAK